MNFGGWDSPRIDYEILPLVGCVLLVHQTECVTWMEFFDQIRSWVLDNSVS